MSAAYRWTIASLCFAGAAACRPSTDGKPLTAEERSEIASAVRERMHATLRALDEGDLAALDTVFATEEGIFSANDSTMSIGRPANARLFSTWLSTVEGVDSTAFDSVHVVPLGRDGAIAISRAAEVIRMTDGELVRERGVWSSAFVRTASGWKMVSAHVSHAPQMPAADSAVARGS